MQAAEARRQTISEQEATSRQPAAGRMSTQSYLWSRPRPRPASPRRDERCPSFALPCVALWPGAVGAQLSLGCLPGQPSTSRSRSDPRASDMIPGALSLAWATCLACIAQENTGSAIRDFSRRPNLFYLAGGTLVVQMHMYLTAWLGTNKIDHIHVHSIWDIRATL